MRFPRNNKYLPEGWKIKLVNNIGYAIDGLWVAGEVVATYSINGVVIKTEKYRELIEEVLTKACAKEDEERANAVDMAIESYVETSPELLTKEGITIPVIDKVKK